MPASVTRPSENEAVVIATLTGHVTLEDMTEVYAQTLDLMRPGEAFIYRITDARQADSNFADMLKILMAVKDAPGSSADPRIEVVFVGTNAWVQMAREFLMRKEYGGSAMPIYFDMDEAYHYIEIHRQNRNRQMEV